MDTSKLQHVEQEALKAVHSAKHLDELNEMEIKFLGRSGKITLMFKELGLLPGEQKKEMGQNLNAVKKKLEALLAEKKQALSADHFKKILEDEWVDITAPGKHYPVGHIHPLSQVQFQVEQIFSDMGFSVMDGPEVESEYYNFEGLNVPSWHPARDMQDTFSIRGEADKKHGRLVLRTQTSPVQIRTMEKYGAPLRIIVPGRVFRNEATDVRHEHTFDQVEGLLIDEHISLAHLKGVMQEFLTRLFSRPVKVRFRPGYFPFVEPGLELDISCMLCSEKGCRVCKHTGWLEFMGAGMVHPNVLKAGGIDPKKYQGWAFGFGLTRLAMMKYDINDIRLLHSYDLRFAEQF